MMMIGDPPPPRSTPTVQIPPSYEYYPIYLEDPAVAHIHSYSSSSNNSPQDVVSPYEKVLASLQRFLPSNKDDVVQVHQHSDSDDFDFDFPVDAFSSDEFRMYEFKVKKCARVRSHDWTECPFAHPGEKARRRDPRMYHYSGTACPEFRKAGGCKKGDACDYSHGVFECWLHPARYRTQPCKDGTHCKRRVCFFAHTPEQLRTTLEASAVLFGSPPSSPTTTAGSSSPVGSIGLVESMRGLHIISKKNLGVPGIGMGMSPPAWGLRYGSPQSPNRIGFRSLPSTPACTIRSNLFDVWEVEEEEEELVMERVESGKLLRDKMYAKLGKENSLDRGSSTSDPDFGWVSELVM